jgi:tetratricopeptide (TPR) repeat protein
MSMTPGKIRLDDILLRMIPYLIAFAVFFLPSCSPRRFPVLRPVKPLERENLIRAKAEDYFILARDFERRGRHPEAERFYEMAYDLDPSSTVLRDQLVRNYLESGKFTQALLLVKGDRPIDSLDADDKRILAGIYIKTGEFQRAIEVIENIAKPSDNDYYSLAIMYESIGNTPKALENYCAFCATGQPSLELGNKIVRMLVGARRYDEADSLVGRIENQAGEKAELFDCRGVIALARGDTAAAIHHFNRAIATDSSYMESARNAAQVYLQKNNYAMAISYYVLLYDRNALYQQVYGRTLAVLYYYNRQYAASETLLKKMLETAFDDDELHYYLGLVFIATKRNNEARLQLEKTIALNPGMDEAWRELCYCAIREKNHDEALSVATRYTKVSPKKPAAWRLKGYVLNLKNDHRRAIEAFNTSLALDSSDVATWFELASSYERNGQIEKAAIMFNKVLKLRPGDASASNYLGYMWAEKGIKLDSASRLLASALKQDPDNGAYLDSYAWICFQNGDYKQAYTYIIKAISRIDNDPVVYEHLGDILVKNGDRSAASEAWRKSLEYKSENEDIIRQKIIGSEPFLTLPACRKGPLK